MLIKCATGFLILALGLAAMTGMAVNSKGIAHVSYESKVDGTLIRIPVPLILADAALAMVPPEDLRELRRQLDQIESILQPLLDSLQECPDATFLEVSGPGERVLVSKARGQLVIDVDTSDESFYLRLPIRGARRLVLAAAGH